MTATRLLAAAVLGCALVVPAAAHADTSVRRDSRNDVRYVGRDDEGSYGGSSTGIPARRHGDIISLRVTHGSKSVTTTLTFASLKRSGNQTHWFQVRGPKRIVDVFLQADDENWKGSKLIYELGSEEELSCRFSHRINYRSNTVKVVIPRTCLLRPAFVRVGAESMIENGSARFYDKAPQRGGSYAAGPPRGPRVYR